MTPKTPKLIRKTLLTPEAKIVVSKKMSKKSLLAV